MNLAFALDQAQRGTWWFDRAPSSGSRKQRRAMANAERRAELLAYLRENGRTLMSDLAAEMDETVQSVRSVALPLIEDGAVVRVVMDGGYIALEVAR